MSSFSSQTYGRAEDDEQMGAQPGTIQSRISAPQLVVVLKPDRTGASAPATMAGNIQRLMPSMQAFGAAIQPLFGGLDIAVEPAAPTAAVSDIENLALYHQVQIPQEALNQEALNKVLDFLLNDPDVEAAYIKPYGEPPTINAMAPAIGRACPKTTPDFTSRQIYLDAAPAGIDARYAWGKNGGRGKDVNIIDLEWGWQFTHEDLKDLDPIGSQALLRGTMSGPHDHGTAVVGVMGGNLNSIGVTGICAEAGIKVVAFGPMESTDIVFAANRLNPGDIMLLEIHRPGPRYNFTSRSDQAGYIPIEWWQDDYVAIRYAVGRGIIVVEAGGNGAENLDDSLYDINPTGKPGFLGRFSSWWVNPFRRAMLDSGAIIVGAGSPPPGTHGNTWRVDRSRLDFSNYGTVIDAQGWGREVTTCGYGDLQGLPCPSDRYYTNEFAGTSSASPIVVGALACLQGILKNWQDVDASGLTPLTPAEARVLLRASGSSQQADPATPVSERIGNRPDLRQLLPLALALRGKVPPAP